MRSGVSVRIFLVDGTPDGLRIVEKSNWTGRAVMCSRAQYQDVRERDEFGRPGVCLLLAPSADSVNRHRLYIGQADDARKRLDQHAQTKDFWTQFILFTSKDENLNRAHVQYLEARLIEIAQRAKRSDLENGNSPNQPKLSEADRADVESFLSDLLLIYPLLGVDAFEIATFQPQEFQNDVQPPPPETMSDYPQPPVDVPRLFLRGPGTNAIGYDTAKGFLVIKGATGRATEVPSIAPNVSALRQKLKQSGVIAVTPTGLELTQDFLFDSPSMAAGMLLGSNVNGRREWKDESGRTLKAIQDGAIPA